MLVAQYKFFVFLTWFFAIKLAKKENRRNEMMGSFMEGIAYTSVRNKTIESFVRNTAHLSQ